MPEPGGTRWHGTAAGAVAVAVVLMLLAGLENGVFPWSPFYIGYVALAIALPLVWRTYRFGPIRDVRWWHWALCPVIAVCGQLLGAVVLNAVYPAILGMSGVPAERMSGPAYNMSAMFAAMFDVAGRRLGMEASRLGSLYLGFLVLWAGLGEELLYRGYLQGALRRRCGPVLAIVAAAFFFAIRHYVQMGLLWPDYPWAAATAWVSIGFLLGLILGFIYEKTGSLWTPVVIHYLFNLVPLVLR